MSFSWRSSNAKLDMSLQQIKQSAYSFYAFGKNQFQKFLWQIFIDNMKTHGDGMSLDCIEYLFFLQGMMYVRVWESLYNLTSTFAAFIDGNVGADSFDVGSLEVDIHLLHFPNFAQVETAEPL